MNILLAPDSFKGTLSSQQIIEIISKQAAIHFPGSVITKVPIADGGEGTVYAILQNRKGRLETISVSNPLFQPINASYGILDAENGGRPSAIIEMAAASGLILVPATSRTALSTTSYGTGELIADALKKGCKNITIAIGGSATNDGGCGAMAALGFRFLDCNGMEVIPNGGNLIHIQHIDTSHALPALKKTALTVMCDVRNPFVGKDGATYIYGKQKGASPEQLDFLEAGMQHFAEVIKRDLGKDITDLPGAGAAGGLGGALHAFLDAHLQSGIETMLELIHFDQLAANMDLIITGEGMADGQSAQGKVLWGVGHHAKKLGIPVVAIVGGMKPDAKLLYECGITAFVPALNQAMALEEVLLQAEDSLNDAAERTFLLLKVGMSISSSISI